MEKSCESHVNQESTEKKCPFSKVISNIGGEFDKLLVQVDKDCPLENSLGETDKKKVVQISQKKKGVHTLYMIQIWEALKDKRKDFQENLPDTVTIKNLWKIFNINELIHYFMLKYIDPSSVYSQTLQQGFLMNILSHLSIDMVDTFQNEYKNITINDSKKEELFALEGMKKEIVLGPGITSPTDALFPADNYKPLQCFLNTCLDECGSGKRKNVLLSEICDFLKRQTQFNYDYAHNVYLHNLAVGNEYKDESQKYENVDGNGKVVTHRIDQIVEDTEKMHSILFILGLYKNEGNDIKTPKKCPFVGPKNPETGEKYFLEIYEYSDQLFIIAIQNFIKNIAHKGFWIVDDLSE